MEKPEAGPESGGGIAFALCEKRKHPRISCDAFAEAVVLEHEALFRGQIRDVSEGGCFIHTAAQVHVELHMEVDLRFVLFNNHFRFEAEVVNIREEEGFGLRFLSDQSHYAEFSLGDLIRALINETVQ